MLAIYIKPVLYLGEQSGPLYIGHMPLFQNTPKKVRPLNANIKGQRHVILRQSEPLNNFMYRNIFSVIHG